MGILPIDEIILPPTDDRVFKLIFTAPDTYKSILADIISAIINRRVIDVVIHNSELPVTDEEEKDERLDVNCTIDDGTQIDIEMQASRIEEETDVKDEHRNLKGKSIYYLCDLHAKQPSKGKRYDKLAQTWQITFCSYTVLPEQKNYVNAYTLRHNEDNSLLSNVLNVVFVELSKLEEVLEKPVNEMSDLEKWSIFLKFAPQAQHREKVNEVIESKEVLQMAGNLLMSISRNKDEQAKFMSRKKARMDRDSDMITSFDNGKAEGKAEGLLEGEAKKANEMARNLKALGVALETIVQASGLSLAQVQAL